MVVPQHLQHLIPSSTTMKKGKAIMYAAVNFDAANLYYMCARACNTVAYCSEYICSQNITVGKSQLSLGADTEDSNSSAGVVDSAFEDIEGAFDGTASASNETDAGLGENDQLVQVGATGE